MYSRHPPQGARVKRVEDEPGSDKQIRKSGENTLYKCISIISNTVFTVVWPSTGVMLVRTH